MPEDDAALVDSWRPAFEALYARDAQNARRQPFAEYWRWVQTCLLEGGAGNPGWLAQRAALLARVRDAEARARLAPLLEALGRAIAGEWAKDSVARRIHSTAWQGRPNLMSWGRALETAARRDTGDGQAIVAVVRAIQAEVDALHVPGAQE